MRGSLLGRRLGWNREKGLAQLACLREEPNPGGPARGCVWPRLCGATAEGNTLTTTSHWEAL